MTENESHIKPEYKYRLNNEEIDLPTSSNEEEKKNMNASIQSDSSQAVLYVPDPSLYPMTQE